MTHSESEQEVMAVTRGAAGDGQAVDASGQAMVRVYVASKSKHGPFWRDQRESWRDHEVPIEVTSTWIDESGEGETADFADLWRHCIKEVAAADLLIACHLCGDEWKGAFVEIGAALALGKRVYIIGKPPGSWKSHPLVTFASDPDDAMADFIGLRHVLSWVSPPASPAEPCRCGYADDVCPHRRPDGSRICESAPAASSTDGGRHDA